LHKAGHEDREPRVAKLADALEAVLIKPVEVSCTSVITLQRSEQWSASTTVTSRMLNGL
jgi:hypothetical protein